MRRDELLRSIQNITIALANSGVLEWARSPREARERKGADVLDMFKSFSEYSAKFGLTENTLMEIFDLQHLNSAHFWFEAATNAKESATLIEVAYNVRAFNVFAPRIVSLLETDATRAKSAAEKQQLAGNDILTTILIEASDQTSRPQRVVDAIRSVTMLYEALAALRGIPIDSLALAGCDSGSDKSFDFLGISDAIKSLKELIIELWDRAVFYKQLRADANLNVALKSLNVVEEISRMQVEEKIGSEDGERLKHQLITGASMFLNCGLTIPEIDAHTVYNPRVLLAPQPKLIAGSAIDGGEASVKTPPPEGGRGLTPEEETELRRLLEKAKSADQ